MNVKRISRLIEVSEHKIENVINQLFITPWVTEDGELLVDSKDLQKLLEYMVDIKFLRLYD